MRRIERSSSRAFSASASRRSCSARAAVASVRAVARRRSAIGQLIRRTARARRPLALLPAAPRGRTRRRAHRARPSPRRRPHDGDLGPAPTATVAVAERRRGIVERPLEIVDAVGGTHRTDQGEVLGELLEPGIEPGDLRSSGLEGHDHAPRPRPARRPRHLGVRRAAARRSSVSAAASPSVSDRMASTCARRSPAAAAGRTGDHAVHVEPEQAAQRLLALARLVVEEVGEAALRQHDRAVELGGVETEQLGDRRRHAPGVGRRAPRRQLRAAPPSSWRRCPGAGRGGPRV